MLFGQESTDYDFLAGFHVARNLEVTSFISLHAECKSSVLIQIMSNPTPCPMMPIEMHPIIPSIKIGPYSEAANDCKCLQGGAAAHFIPLIISLQSLGHESLLQRSWLWHLGISGISFQKGHQDWEDLWPFLTRSPPASLSPQVTHPPLAKIAANAVLEPRIS